MPSTPNSKLPYPSASDLADVPADLQRLAVALDEIAYAQITTNVTVTATTEATGNPIVTAPAITFDGATAVMIEFFTPLLFTPAVANALVELSLWQDSAPLGLFGRVLSPGAVGAGVPVRLARRITPAAGARTYAIRAWQSGGTGGVVVAGPGNAPAANQPAYIRISRA